MSRAAPALRTAVLSLAVVAFAVGVVCLLEVTGKPAALLSNPPELRAKNGTLSLTLHAAVANGKNAFSFNAQSDAPTLRLVPGDTLKIAYINDLPPTPPEKCLAGPCMDMTNLHFHGLAISPHAPQDDVLTMMAMPGKTLNYTVQIPKDHSPGLYWYHTHPHGESYRQALDGMSGALVIEGIESYFPALIGMRERVLVVRGRSLKKDPESSDLMHRVDLSSETCGSEHEAPDE